jgi:hypothetical protein
MDYKDDFFTAYRKYLEIPEVKAGHNRIFDIFMHIANCNGGIYVNDFGCGTCEFGRYLRDYRSLIRYTGFDLDISRADLGNDPRCNVQVGNYNMVLPDGGALVVSLFATEIHKSLSDREALYDKWQASGVRHILVGGFYYDNFSRDVQYTEPVTGLTIYQTPVWASLRPGELRLTQQVPAGMFTEPFTEVWRIL